MLMLHFMYDALFICPHSPEGFIYDTLFLHFPPGSSVIWKFLLPHFPSPGACTCFTQIHAELTYEFLISKELRTYSCAVFLIPTNYLNRNHQHSLAAETAKGTWGCIPGAQPGDLGDIGYPLLLSTHQLHLDTVPQHRKDINKLQQVQWWSGLEQCFWGRGLVQPGTEMVSGSQLPQYL